MSMDNPLLMLLAGAGGAAIVNAISQIIQWILNRRAKLKDDEKNAKTLSVQDLSEKIITIESGLRAILHDRIKFLARCYIERQEVDYDDYKDLTDMHDAYRALGGKNLVRPIEDVSKITMLYK